ncbi:MAG: hypothetical protein BWY29_00276 [Microgenomates group bacterium ADurb.Bin238]|nr:MAG: hypothetical protein BWY29_00276 [Microgenomates group bacterium ADurb.Bin238]
MVNKMTDVINNLKNIFVGVSVYQILEGVALPIILFILGIFIEHKYQITNNIFNKFNLKLKQSGENNAQSLSKQESGRDSINTSSSTSIKGPFFGQQNIYSSTPTVAQAEDALKPPEPLLDTEYNGTNTDYIINCFEKHSKKLGVTSTFKDDLIEVHKDLNTYKNVDVSSARYFSVFKDVMENLTKSEIFCEREGADLAIAEVNNTFDKLEKLMSKPNKKLSDLETLIETFERNIVRLLAYI